MKEVESIVADYNNCCAYCDAPAEALDHLFPLKEQAPNASGNVVPTCLNCRSTKKHRSLQWFFSSNNISQDRYVKIVQKMLENDTPTNVLREHMKKVTGIG